MKYFSDETVTEAKKEIGMWLTTICDKHGYGSILIEINVEQRKIDIKPQPYIRIKEKD